MHILDDPGLSPRVTTLLARARRGTALPAECVRELAARAEAFAGDAAAVPPEAVEAMIRFEERYGGLWYPLLGSNGMEHGLDGGTLVHRGADGWSFSGIVDGDRTSTVDVLLDQRTAMTLAGRPASSTRDLPAAVDSVRRSVTGGMWREEEWCAVCAHSREPAQPCLGTP